MKCRDVERWLILGADGPSDAGRSEALRAHLESCVRCASLKDELEDLRADLPRRGDRALSPPAGLVERTRARCRELLDAPESRPARPVSRSNGAFRRIPRAVWASTIGLLLLTALILVPFFGDVILSERLSYISWIGFSFIIQNMLMLLASPLLIGRWRRAES